MSRRLVVVLFLDLVGWTRLAERVDPEPLQLLLEQYYEICSTAVEEHSGIVEKFIGDAIMAVFGADRSSEDDALRALRAAVQIRADVGELTAPLAQPVEVHCGIAAGEALVTRSSRAGLRVVGDVVNLAARLQSAAVAGEIIVNEIVAHLAGHHFTMLPVPPLSLKGKAGLIPALRAIGPAGVADQVDDGSPMVDRGAERARLRAAYHRMVREQRSQTVTVVGPPGIGKTRLVREALAELAGAGADVTAMFASCPSYGPNGNHLALLQVLDAVLRQAAPSRALLQVDAQVAAVLEGLRHASLERRDSGPGPGVEEISRAARELLGAAATRPLVVVWDSLEWAGLSLLHLIGELTESLRHRPLLTICVGRAFAASPDPRAGAEVIEVGALTPADSAELAGLLTVAGAGAEVQAHDLELVDRVTVHGAGNPLFIRLMVESAAPGRPVDQMPPTITAMVGAMIDRLPAAAREVLSAASVVGYYFTVQQLAALGEPAPAAGLDALEQRELIRSTPHAGGYSFVQQPVHEVAYGRLDKQQRLTWHRRLADHDLSPAFHLEAAVRLLGDLRPHDAELPALSGSAAEALLREGTAALRQRDVPAAIDLLDRSLQLMPDGEDRAVAAIRLSDALLLAGDTRRAVDVVTEAGQRSAEARVRRACLVQQHLLAVRLGRLSDAAVADLRHELGGDPADRLAGCRFEQLQMLLHLGQGRFGAAEQAALTALAQARAIGAGYEEDRLLVALCEIRQWAPTPIAEQLSGCAELAGRFAADRFLLVPVLAARARCLALIGDRGGARAALAEAGTAVRELRLTMGQVLVDQAAGLACSLDGEHAEAERHFRRAAAALEQAGHVPSSLTLRVQAARESARQQPTGAAPGEIAALLARREEMDVRGRILGMSTAVLLAAGDAPPAASIGEVMALLATTDDPCLRGDVYFDLARTHRRLGSQADARRMADAAVGSYTVAGATRPRRSVLAWI